jgi:CubicO group peptidase (beta-lactamase class C family)
VIQRPVSARIGLFTLALATSLETAASGQAGAEMQPAQVDALFAAWNAPGSPGCAIGVMSQGKLVYAKGYGLADVEHGTPLSPDCSTLRR